MYELHRVYTGIVNKYVEGIGWVSKDADTNGNKVAMYEIEYMDLDDEGKIHYTGTEDFSIRRYRELNRRFVTVKEGYEKNNPALKTKYGWKIIYEKTVFVRKLNDVKAYYKQLFKKFEAYDTLKIGSV